MSFNNPFQSLGWEHVFDSALSDFVLAFAFFTAVIYAVLAKRFDHQRSAVTASAALALALSVGLVWWEQSVGLSIRNLGPWAVGFAIIILAMVMYQAIRQTGGSWAGAALALGGSLLIGWALGMRWQVAQEIIQTVITVMLIVGMVAFLLHRQAGRGGTPWSGLAGSAHEPEPQLRSERNDLRDLQRGRQLSNRLVKRFKQLEREADHLHEHPEDAQDIMLQIRRMLPAEGWLTERLAGLREKLRYVEQGEAHRIKELEAMFGRLSPEERARVLKKIAEHYKEVKLDVRLDRLDGAVAENERRIIQLTREAQACVAADDAKKLHDVLKAAEKLQKHNSRLFKLIDSTEKKVLGISRQLAQGQSGAKGN
jgi:hypothetical protein